MHIIHIWVIIFLFTLYIIWFLLFHKVWGLVEITVHSQSESIFVFGPSDRCLRCRPPRHLTTSMVFAQSMKSSLPVTQRRQPTNKHWRWLVAVIKKQGYNINCLNNEVNGDFMFVRSITRRNLLNACNPWCMVGEGGDYVILSSNTIKNGICVYELHLFFCFFFLCLIKVLVVGQKEAEWGASCFLVAMSVVFTRCIIEHKDK